MDSSILYFLGLTLIFVGVLVLIFAAILVAARRSRNGKTKTAGLIIIGPVPIVFGSDKKTVKNLMVLAIILTVALIVAFLLYYCLFM